MGWLQSTRRAPVLSNSRNHSRAPSPEVRCVRTPKEQNTTQTILPLVREGYKFSVSNLMVLFFPFFFLLSVFICQTKGLE